jgi:hypothetical protein
MYVSFFPNVIGGIAILHLEGAMSEEIPGIWDGFQGQAQELPSFVQHLLFS